LRTGENIQRIREIMGLSRKALAFALDVTEPAVEKLEKKKIVALQIMNKVASVLKIDVEEIKSFNEDEFIANRKMPRSIPINSSFISSEIQSLNNLGDREVFSKQLEQIRELKSAIYKLEMMAQLNADADSNFSAKVIRLVNKR